MGILIFVCTMLAYNTIPQPLTTKTQGFFSKTRQSLLNECHIDSNIIYIKILSSLVKSLHGFCDRVGYGDYFFASMVFVR